MNIKSIKASCLHVGMRAFVRNRVKICNRVFRNHGTTESNIFYPLRGLMLVKSVEAHSSPIGEAWKRIRRSGNSEIVFVT
ncbi:hypothetical protein TNCV_89011 [Trichonephila clavipes]|nr:hypothetical protein TNCV_89011 [Trichonephila clavipes]